MLTLSTLRVNTLLYFQALFLQKPYLDLVMISPEGTKKGTKIIRRELKVTKRNLKEPKEIKKNQKEQKGTKRNHKE